MANLSSGDWQVLLVDDDEDDYLITLTMLSQAKGRKITLDWAPSFETGQQRLAENHYHAVLVDYSLPPRTGIELIREAASRGYPAPLIVFTGQGSYEADVEAMKAGASLYLTKAEVNPLSLERFIGYAIERKRIEQELDHRLQERSIILDSIQDGLFGVNQDWQITYINSRAARNVGFEPQELVGKNLWKALPKIQGTLAEEYYRRAMLEHIPLQFEMHGTYTDRWYTIAIYPSTDGISAYWQDITERKRSEDALRESEHKFSLLFENAAFAAALSRMPDGALVNVNDAWVKLFRFEKQEAIGKTTFELNINLNSEAREHILTQLRECGSVRDQEMTLHTKSGESRILSVNIDVIEIGGQKYILNVAQDITARKQSEQLLETAHAEMVNEKNRLLAVMEALPVGLAILDEEGKYIQFNRAFEELWGKPRPVLNSSHDFSAYQASWLDSGQPVQPEEWASARVIQKAETVVGQLLKIQRSDGTHSIVVNSGAPIRDAQGHITGSAVAIMDITEQKQMEIKQQEYLLQMELQRRLMEYREQERQQIARNLHDRPVQDLCALLFDIQSVQDRISDPRIIEAIDQLALGLKDTIQNLRETINEIRLPALFHFGFAKVLQYQLEIFAEKHPQIELHTSLMDDGGCLSEQARLNLFRIFQEALNNTTRHASPTQITVQFGCTSNQVLLEIQDNGKGFSLSGNFLEYSDAGHYGLVGMKEHAEAIGGRLEIQSEPQKGTTLRVILPIEK